MGFDSPDALATAPVEAPPAPEGGTVAPRVRPAVDPVRRAAAAEARATQAIVRKLKGAKTRDEFVQLANKLGANIAPAAAEKQADPVAAAPAQAAPQAAPSVADQLAAQKQRMTEVAEQVASVWSVVGEELRGSPFEITDKRLAVLTMGTTPYAATSDGPPISPKWLAIATVGFVFGVPAMKLAAPPLISWVRGMFAEKSAP